MKDFKFKVWGKEEKSFIKNCVLKADGSIARPVMKNDYDISSLKEDQYVACLYTGVLDKNGKEIYEDDIIKAKIGVMDFIFKVEFEHGKFMAVEDDDDELTAFGLFTITDKCEVIGNIHENPEMLK